MNAVEKQILDVEQKTVDAFNAARVDEILNYFDEELIGFSSTQHERLVGLESLRDTFLYYLKEAEKVEYSITSPLVKMLNETTAILTFYWLVVLINGNRRREIHGRGTHVFVKKNGAWKIIHEHFSRAHHG